MRQALPYFVILIMCGCAGSIAPRRQVARHSPAPAVQSAAPPVTPAASTPVTPAAAPMAWRAPVSATAGVPQEPLGNPGNLPPVIPVEKPHGLLNPEKTTVSGSFSIAVGYEHDSRVGRIGRTSR